MSFVSNRILRSLLTKKSHFCNSLRTFVSPSFSCTSAWNDRLQSESLSKIKTVDHFKQVRLALDHNAFVAAIDVDILSNKLQDISPLSLEYIENLFKKFRHSNESVKALPSTYYAFFRTMMDLDEHEELLCLLGDKSNYGFFLDNHTSIMLLDHFLEKESYKSAAMVVFDLMLQEDFNDPIVKALSFYACHMFIKMTPEFKIEAPPTMSNELELIYRKVRYITTPWYDDHFDMYGTNQKLGKSLMMLSNSDDAASRGFLFIGNILYLKFDKAMSLLTGWLDSLDSSIMTEEHVECAERFLNSIEVSAPRELPDELGLVRLGHLLPYVTAEQKAEYINQFLALKERLIAEGKVAKDINIEGRLMDVIHKSLAENEGKVIEKQMKLFAEWNEMRDSILKEHIERLATKKKRDDLAQRIIDLKNKEEKLRYFEEKINIDLVLENRPEYPKIKDVVVEEQYVLTPSERKSEKKKDAKN